MAGTFACVRQAIMVQIVRMISMNVLCINHVIRPERNRVKMESIITPAFATLVLQVIKYIILHYTKILMGVYILY